MIPFDKGIKIYGTGDKGYEQDTKKVLELIKSFAVGSAVIKAIGVASDAKKTVLTVVPYKYDPKNDPEHLGPCNASTERQNEDAAEDGEHPDGDTYYLGRGDDPATRDHDERYDKSTKKGTGAGSDADVHFTAGIWGQGKDCSKGKIGALPDELLLHEMVHALRDMEGHRRAQPLEGGLKPYDNLEEYLAILVANIYISAKDKTGKKAVPLRGGDPDEALPDAQSTSVGFLKVSENAALLRRLWHQESSLFHDLNLVDWPRFNPIHELLTNPGKYGGSP